MSYYIEMKKCEFFVPTHHTGIVFAKMQNYPYDFELDNDGNIVDVEFIGEKLRDDFAKFRSIASYVKDGSFIEMIDEQGEQWRWVFKDGTCCEITPKVSWQEE